MFKISSNIVSTTHTHKFKISSNIVSTTHTHKFKISSNIVSTTHTHTSLRLVVTLYPRFLQFVYIVIYLLHIISKFDFFIGVDMVMCHALICVKEIHQSLT